MCSVIVSAKPQNSKQTSAQQSRTTCSCSTGPSVSLGCNRKCNRNSCNFATNYHRTFDDSKCCSTCTMPHFICYLTSDRNPTYDCAMAQPLSCWPLSMETEFNARPALVGFVLVTVALGQFFQVFWLFKMLHTHSYITNNMILANDGCHSITHFKHATFTRSF